MLFFHIYFNFNRTQIDICLTLIVFISWTTILLVQMSMYLNHFWNKRRIKYLHQSFSRYGIKNSQSSHRYLCMCALNISCINILTIMKFHWVALCSLSVSLIRFPSYPFLSFSNWISYFSFVIYNCLSLIVYSQSSGHNQKLNILKI